MHNTRPAQYMLALITGAAIDFEDFIAVWFS